MVISSLISTCFEKKKIYLCAEVLRRGCDQRHKFPLIHPLPDSSFKIWFLATVPETKPTSLECCLHFRIKSKKKRKTVPTIFSTNSILNVLERYILDI
jgi:hypothetical protein